MKILSLCKLLMRRYQITFHSILQLHVLFVLWLAGRFQVFGNNMVDVCVEMVSVLPQRYFY